MSLISSGKHSEFHYHQHQENTLTVFISTNPDIAPPSASSVTKADDIFYPNRTDLTETDSVVLPVDKITPYLDKALAALCLHTEARTSFIT